MAITYSTGCKTKETYLEDGFQLIENTDGTVSIYDQNQAPVTAHETKSCCETLGYTFDNENQKCRWAENLTELFKVVLNPQGNESTFFRVEENETCNVDVSFDYLFKFDCGALQESVIPSSEPVDQPTLIERFKLNQEIIRAQADCDRWQLIIDDASNIPYVIECSDGGLITTPGGGFVMDQELYFHPRTRTKLPPGAYGEYDPNIVTYCLTNEGLAAWQIELNKEARDGEIYDAWFNSNGTDTSTYTCDNVKLFVETEPSIGLWYTTNCDYTIYDRAKARDQISNAEANLETCLETVTRLENELLTLTTISQTGDTTSCNTYVEVFENFNACFTLEKLNEETGLLETVYEEIILNIGSGNLYEYIDVTSGNTGIIISGDTNLMPTAEETALIDSQGRYPTTCLLVRDELTTELYNQYLESNPIPSGQTETQALKKQLTTWYQSCWLQFETKISDPEVISLIENEKVNMTIAIKDCCTDFSILLDRIKLTKNCEKVDNIETFISEPPKFNLRKVCDNKKSWLTNEERDSRDFELKYRGTEYNTNHHRLVINTKEVDLSLSPARAVEQDVWCYINDNNCILEGYGDSNMSFSAFTCPSGFTVNVDGNSCEKLTTTATTSGDTALPVAIGYNIGNESHSLVNGTIFTEDITDKPWPITWNNNLGANWSGPYYNAAHLVDYSGNPIQHDGWGEKYALDGSLLYSSPRAFSGLYSDYSGGLTPTVNGRLNPNLLWGGGVGYSSYSGVSSSVPSNYSVYNDLGGSANPLIGVNSIGPAVRNSVWATPYGTSVTNDQWIGLSKCLNLTEEKLYHIGFTGDDEFRVKINGEWLYNEELYSIPGSDVNTANGGGKNNYHVVGVRLAAGRNYVEIEGRNTRGGAAGLVLEIYDAPLNVLKYIRYQSELSAVTVFSTVNEIGNTFPLGENNGFSCPTDYSIDTCITTPYQCVKVEKVTRSLTQVDSCCEGTPVLVKNYENYTIELPLDYSTGTTLDCNDIQTLIDGYSATTTLEEIETVKCGVVYAIGTGSTTEFNGYWIAQENDSTIGVYVKEWTSGSTDTYENVSNQVTSECCSIISSAFSDYADMFEQGVDRYKGISWDPNTERCVYRNCGDDGCINIDTMLTTELSEIDTVKEFETTLISELIDVKSRQTISAYPTIRMLYDRYNNHALEYCDVQSSRYDYFDMDNFGQTVGNYWIDLIEQVVPATTIWGSTYTYKNTIFDTQKYQYRRNTTFLCDDPSVNFPWSAISTDSTIDIITETLPKIIYSSTTNDEGNIEVVELTIDGDSRLCNSTWSMQHTCDSTFLGRVVTDETVIQVPVPCTLSNISIETTQTEIGIFSSEALYGLPVVGPITFQWSDGQTGQTATGLTEGTYNVVVTDNGASACTAYAETIITNETDACWYRLPEETQHVLNESTTPILSGSDTFTQTFSISSIVINGATTNVTYSESLTATTGSTNINWISADNNTVSGATTGLTYTNYVEFLNNAFIEAGVYPEYHAQISTGYTIDRGTIYSGFYIVRPAGDTFIINIENDGGYAFNQHYTESSYGVMTSAGAEITTSYEYEVYTCEGITTSNGIVIE